MIGFNLISGLSFSDNYFALKTQNFVLNSIIVLFEHNSSHKTVGIFNFEVICLIPVPKSLFSLPNNYY